LDLAVERADAVMVRADLGVIASVVALSHRGDAVADIGQFCIAPL
jgi:hypothetical protein